VGILSRILGIDEIVKSFEENLRALEVFNLKREREDSLELLKRIANLYNVNLDVKKVQRTLDDKERLTSLASNVTPLEIEKPEEVLWELAQAIKPKGRKCQQ
jgi:hypothetical protein